MKIEDMNILRAVAKSISDESAKATKGVKAQKERDVINAEIIDRNYKKVEGRYSRIQLIYAVGVVRGILRDPS